MSEPEPGAPAMPAVPVGEEGKDFFGLWIGAEMDMGGEVMQLFDWEIVMNLLLPEDGRLLMDKGDSGDEYCHRKSHSFP